MAVTWRFEAWTHPRLGTATRILGDIPFHRAQLADRDDAVVDSFIEIPATRQDLIDELLDVDPVTMASSRSRIVRAFRVDDEVAFDPNAEPDHEFVCADVSFQITDTGKFVARISGPDFRGTVDEARLLTFDYPANPSRARDWQWQGPNLFDNGALENISDEIQSFWITGIAAGDTFTITFDGQTTTAITWGSDINQRQADVKAALEALSNIGEVDIIGEGTELDPIEIMFLDPADTNLPTISITPSAGTATVATESTGGYASLEGWTKSWNPITGEEHGAYTDFRVTSPDLGETGLEGSAAAVTWTSPAGEASRYSGAQIIIGVTPGQLLQIRIRAKASNSGETFRLVTRDLIGDTESRLPSGSTPNIAMTAGVEQTFTLTDVPVPAHVDRILVRFAITSAPATSIQVTVDNLEIREGLEGTTKGGIVTRVLQDLQTDHAPRTRLDYLTPSFTDATDTSGTPWADAVLPYAARNGMQFGTHFLGGLQKVGTPWDVTPNGLTAWDLDLWDEANRGTDHTADKAITFLIGQLPTGRVQKRLPAETNVFAMGAEGVWTETEDADMTTAFGAIDGYIDSEDWLDTTTTAAAATEHLATSRANAVSVGAVSTSERGPIPWKQVRVGDTANFTLGDDLLAKHPRQIRQATVTIHPNGKWTCEWTASRIFMGKAAIEETLRQYLTEFQFRRFKRERNSTVPPLPATGGGTIPWLVAASNSPAEWIAVAAYQCDGTADEVEINAALVANREVWCAPGTYNVDVPDGGRAIYVDSGRVLRGLGDGAALIQDSGVGAFSFTTESWLIENRGSLLGLSIISDWNDQVGCVNTQFSTGSLEGLWIEKATVGTITAAVLVHRSSALDIEDCYFDGSPSSTPEAGCQLRISRSQNLNIRGCVFTGGTEGIILRDLATSGLTNGLIDITACTITQMWYDGIIFDGPQWSSVHDCTFYGNGRDVSPFAAATPYADLRIDSTFDFNVHDCRFETGNGQIPSIAIVGSFDGFVSGCRMEDVAIHVIYVDGGGTIQIHHNTIPFDSGMSASNTWDMIHVTGAADDIFIEANLLGTQNGTGQSRYGINFADATITNSKAVGNSIGDTATAPINVTAGAGVDLAYPADATYGDNWTTP